MVDDLLRALGEFKANIEYRNVDFNADKNKQYGAVRKAMAREYSSGDVDLFGPEETTAIPEDVEESQRKELVEKDKSEKALIKKGFSRVMEKIKELRQKFSNAVTMGSRSGSRKLVMEFHDVMLKRLGRIMKNQRSLQSPAVHHPSHQLGWLAPCNIRLNVISAHQSSPANGPVRLMNNCLYTIGVTSYWSMLTVGSMLIGFLRLSEQENFYEIAANYICAKNPQVQRHIFMAQDYFLVFVLSVHN
ncbi:hypothetical protein AWC38_SpisGene18254 [Stylophora pistillata]|uniref:Uncharacterized protein n=1 Tax=Stylophora pistillata TaxID=50429 RepID=A0A2B4RKT8_STYPI|nr:hypothetical protein AWC38_SpisGene18254 [Stylophora pistillata]